MLIGDRTIGGLYGTIHDYPFTNNRGANSTYTCTDVSGTNHRGTYIGTNHRGTNNTYSINVYMCICFFFSLYTVSLPTYLPIFFVNLCHTHTMSENWPVSGRGRPLRPDWPCPKCNYMVYGSKSECPKCLPRPPISLARPPGTDRRGKVANLRDWTCPKCNFLIFGSKDKCKCGAVRPVRIAKQGECTICFGDEAAIMVFNCGHTACSTCSERLDGKCPFCKQRITSTIRLFMN